MNKFQTKEMFEESDYLFQHIHKGIQHLKTCGIENAKKEIEWFVTKTFNVTLSQIKCDNTKKLQKKEIIIFEDFIKRRRAQEPFQYIINSAPFYNEDFYVNEAVLIPRPETEIIIEILKKQHFKEGLDVGTGCGNLAITLRLENIVEKITGIDISKKALAIATKNANFFNLKGICFKKQNLFKIKSKQKYDLVVSNPPYISLKDYRRLPQNIKNYEPKRALTDDQDGYVFYKFFANNLFKLLKPRGTMILEIGFQNTQSKIESFFNKQCSLRWHKDYNGNNRILQIDV